MNMNEERTLGRLEQKIDNLTDTVNGFSRVFVTKDQFWPVRTIVYGLVAIIMVAVVGTLVYSVLQASSAHAQSMTSLSQ